MGKSVAEKQQTAEDCKAPWLVFTLLEVLVPTGVACDPPSLLQRPCEDTCAEGHDSFCVVAEMLKNICSELYYYNTTSARALDRSLSFGPGPFLHPLELPAHRWASRGGLAGPHLVSFQPRSPSQVPSPPFPAVGAHWRVSRLTARGTRSWEDGLRLTPLSHNLCSQGIPGAGLLVPKSGLE